MASSPFTNPLDPNTWVHGWEQFTAPFAHGADQIGSAFQNGADQIGNAVTGIFGTGFLGSGLTPARIGKGMHQALVSTAGVGLIIVGFILIVSGTKTAQNVVSSLTKVAAVAAV